MYVTGKLSASFMNIGMTHQLIGSVFLCSNNKCMTSYYSLISSVTMEYNHPIGDIAMETNNRDSETTSGSPSATTEETFPSNRELRIYYLTANIIGLSTGLAK